MIFQKRSTRTRVSTEAGMAQLGGHALFLGALIHILRAVARCNRMRDVRVKYLLTHGFGVYFSLSSGSLALLTGTLFVIVAVAAAAPAKHAHARNPSGSEDIQLGKNESLRDTARVLSRFNDVLLARVYGHGDILELCAESTVPVINALSDLTHPLQGLADVLTLRQHFGSTKGLTVAWVGDGNNITHTLLSAAAPCGFNLRVATPVGYEAKASVVARARKDCAATGVSITTTHDPLEAVAGAHVIVTDTWVSMGQEGEAAARKASFAGYQVTEAMAAAGGADPRWVFLHCLPRKPQEVDDAVFYSPTRSLVWDEAENRKWTVMAVILAQLQGGAAVPMQ